MAKAKSEKKKRPIPFLKKDLNLEPAVARRLSRLQNKFATKFKDEIDKVKQDTEQRYTQRVEFLLARKAEVVAELDEEIKKYQTLLGEIKEVNATTEVKPTPPKRTRRRKTPPKE